MDISTDTKTNMTILTEIDYPVLKDYEVTSDPIKNLALTDPVLCFNDANQWTVIDLRQFLKTPIIWTKYYEAGKAKDVSIVVCPRTMRSCVFPGKLHTKYYDGNNLYLENEEESLIPIDINISIDLHSEVEINKRYQVYIQTLRNSLVDYYDIKYLHSKETHKYIINKNYLHNRLDELDQDIQMYEVNIHPKTLCHVIQYVSEKGERKNTMLIGSDSTNFDTMGYDNKKSGFDKYLSDYGEKIIEKNSFIMPVLYYKGIELYKHSKKIIL